MSGLEQRRRRAVGHWLLLAGIMGLNLWGSWHWVRANVVILGNDATGYLENTLEFADRLALPSRQTLFQLLTLDNYRPPLLFLAVQPFYGWFGIHPDSAQLFNVLCLIPVIWLTYELGATVAGRQAGYFAALLVGLYPLLAAMARLFYTEIFLTVMVTLNLLALIRSRGFTGRGWSLVWGASLGLGLLIKWTMPFYLALPLLIQLWRAKIWRSAGLRFDWRTALPALAGGFLLSGLWVWPNRQALADFPLGNGLFWGWLLLATGLLYLLLLTPTPLNNFCTALLLGATLASLWYLPHADFAARLLHEDSVRGQFNASPLNPYNYWRNIAYLYEEHLGALAFWLIVPAIVAPWLWRLLRRQPLPPQAGLLGWSLLSALLALGLISQSNSRNLVPLLPIFALLGVMSLQLYPRRWALLLGSSWVLVLGGQWASLTFDRFGPLYTGAQSLWVVDNYATQPSSNRLSPLYAIGDDLVSIITTGQTSEQGLGMLIHDQQLHRGTLSYHFKVRQANAEVVPLTDELSAGWFDMLLYAPWVLLKAGDNHQLNPTALGLVERILHGDPLFHALYSEVKRYPLPNNQTAYLYHRVKGPDDPLETPGLIDQTRPVAEAMRAAASAQATTVYAHSGLAYWVGLHDPAPGPTLLLEAEQNPAEVLDSLQGTLLMVWDYNTEHLRHQLEPQLFPVTEIGDAFAAVAIYGRPAQTLQPIPVAAAWEGVTISSVATLPQLPPGAVLPLEVQVQGEPAPNGKFSFRLLDTQGQPMASNDRPAQPADRLGLLIPPATPPGDYQVVALLYDEMTLLPYPTTTGAEIAPLFTVTVKE